MSPRTKGRLVGVALLALLGGALAYALASAPPPDLVPVLTEFLVLQDQGRALESLRPSGLGRRWDQTAVEHASRMRVRMLGRFVRVVSSDPPEEVHEDGLVVRKLRARLAFERKEAEGVFTFVRVGADWRLLDFDLPLKDPRSLTRGDELARRTALEALEEYGKQHYEQVWRTLARVLRRPDSIEGWSDRGARLVEPLGPFQAVEQRAWTFAQARGLLEARVVFEQGALEARVEAALEPGEGRWVITRFEIGP